jgi:hypothetical protein
MSKYFEEVDFPLEEDPTLPKPPKPKMVFNPESVVAATARIRAEFDKIKHGTSDHTQYAINPGHFGFPADNRLKIFELDPTEENYVAFVQISKQDFGVRAAAYFAELLNVCKEKNSDV